VAQFNPLPHPTPRHAPTGGAGELTPDHVALLRHMHEVGKAQLDWHSQEYVRGTAVLAGKAKPPAHYDFPRGAPSLPVAGGRGEAAAGGAGAAACPPSPLATPPPHRPLPDSQTLMCFHSPGYNSVDHLHLHAIAKPFAAWWETGHFAVGSAWVLLWKDAHERLVAGLPAAGALSSRATRSARPSGPVGGGHGHAGSGHSDGVDRVAAVTSAPAAADGAPASGAASS
jgi:hypothetical protein